MAKRVETHRSEQSINGGPDTNITEEVTTTYYIYSSVLGGRKVVELGENGEKTFGYVYANGLRLAKQWVQSDPTAVKWRHTNPGLNSWVATTTERMANREELDPDQAEVGTQDPWANIVQEVPPTYEKQKAENEPLYIEGGDPFDYSGGCTSFGMPISCSDASSMLARGLGQINGIDVSGPTRRGPQTNQNNSSVVEETLIQITHVWSTTNGLRDGEGAWRYYRDTVTKVVNIPTAVIHPQNPTTIPVGDLKGNLEALLKSGDCEHYTNLLLAEAAKRYANPAHLKHINTIMEGYGMVHGQGDYVLRQTAYDTVEGDLFNEGMNVDAGPGTVLLVPNRVYGSPTPKQLAFFSS